MDPVSFIAWRFWAFFRDPERTPPPGRVVVAPADGRVLYVTPVAAGSAPSPVKAGVRLELAEWAGLAPPVADGWLVGIYMTPLSVHVNRAPVAGRVRAVAARPARTADGANRSMVRAFMRLLWRLEPYAAGSAHVVDNARNTVFIAGELTAAVVQIADRYVSVVDCFVAAGDTVSLGQRIGFIRMGSQCDLLVGGHPDLCPCCRPGDRVRAGETVLARY